MTNLPVPTLASEVPGNYVTSALWNANVYNGLSFVLGPPDFVGYQNTAQSLSSGSWTALSLDASTLDSYGGHSNTTNNSRYTCQSNVAGWYTCCGVYAPVGNSSGFRAVRLQVNGSPLLGAGSYLPNNGTSDAGYVTPTRDVYLNVGDYVEVAGWQSSGGSLNTTIDPELRCALWVRFSHS